jgi:hypothetical protein
MADQGGMRAISVAVVALAHDPNPPEAFIRGDYRRLRVGRYRIMYVVDDDLITIERPPAAEPGASGRRLSP